MATQQQQPQGAIPYRLIRRNELEQIIGLSRSTIYARMDENSSQYDATFPRPVNLGNSKSIAWVEAEVQNWIASRIAASRGKSVEVQPCLH